MSTANGNAFVRGSESSPPHSLTAWMTPIGSQAVGCRKWRIAEPELHARLRWACIRVMGGSGHRQMRMEGVPAWHTWPIVSLGPRHFVVGRDFAVVSAL